MISVLLALLIAFTSAQLNKDTTNTLNPTDAADYYNRGYRRAKEGDIAGAIADFTQAIALDPTIAAAYGNRGVVRAGNHIERSGRYRCVISTQGAVHNLQTVMAIPSLLTVQAQRVFAGPHLRR